MTTPEAGVFIVFKGKRGAAAAAEVKEKERKLLIMKPQCCKLSPMLGSGRSGSNQSIKHFEIK